MSSKRVQVESKNEIYRQDWLEKEESPVEGVYEYIRIFLFAAREGAALLARLREASNAASCSFPHVLSAGT